MTGAEKHPDFFKVFLQEQHSERMVLSATITLVFLEYYSEYCDTLYGLLNLLKIVRVVRT